MRIKNQYFWMILISVFLINIFYNPTNFSLGLRITWILLSCIGWEVSQLTQKTKLEKTFDKIDNEDSQGLKEFVEKGRKKFGLTPKNANTEVKKK